MRSFIAILGSVLALACTAAPALAMPAVDSRSDSVIRHVGVPEPVFTGPAGDASGAGAGVVVLIGAAALVAGAGLGFGAARAPRRARSATAS